MVCSSPADVVFVCWAGTMVQNNAYFICLYRLSYMTSFVGSAILHHQYYVGVSELLKNQKPVVLLLKTDRFMYETV